MTMRVFSSPTELQKELFEKIGEKKTIGFVPTMGFLHNGHLELVKTARKNNDLVVVSIFVNKKQFGENEDFASYPSNINSDKEKLISEGVDYLFHPSQDDIYPSVFLSELKVTEITNFLCGLSRPGHFDGVALIVSKLLNIVMPDSIYFGQKDYQQCLVIKQMMTDLNFRTKMVICPIVREDDGLAMSSRNSYLSDVERQNAPYIFKTLNQLKDKITYGKENKNSLVTYFKSEMDNIGGKIDYIEFTDLKSLKTQTVIAPPVLIATAVFIGKTRLIDNIIIE